MPEETVIEPAAVTPPIQQIPTNNEPQVIFRKEPASNVYVCSCGHQWRTTAQNPLCSKCGSSSARRATLEEKRAFNRRMKKKPETPVNSQTVNNTPQAVTPALVSQFSNGDNEFVTPEALKPELKKPEEVTPALQGAGLPPAIENKKFGSKLNFKALVMWGCVLGACGAGWILIKKKLQRIPRPRKAAVKPRPEHYPDTVAAAPAPEEEEPKFSILDTPAGFS